MEKKPTLASAHIKKYLKVPKIGRVSDYVIQTSPNAGLQIGTNFVFYSEIWIILFIIVDFFSFNQMMVKVWIIGFSSTSLLGTHVSIIDKYHWQRRLQLAERPDKAAAEVGKL